VVRSHPEWSRYRLSRELCVLWDWRSDAGQWKDMAARTLLLKLEQRGWIRLPPRRMASPNRHRLAAPSPIAWDTTPVRCALRDLGPLRISEVSGDPERRRQVHGALAQFHYLGYRAPVGENLHYLVQDQAARPLAVLVFGAAAWKCAARDRWIGWTPSQREQGLGRIANNSRFLILPWVQVRHLASRILGTVAERIAADWQRKYAHPVVLLESFVERQRFTGSCYRAANWQSLGLTTGRTRQDRYRSLQTPLKEVLALPLRADFRKELIG
jgi:hypothetical protein